jgi:hypothetical protein
MLHTINNVRPSLNDRLTQSAINFRAAADLLAPGPKHDALIAKAHEADVAIEMNAWLSSSELRSPT